MPAACVCVCMQALCAGTVLSGEEHAFLATLNEASACFQGAPAAAL